MSNALQKARDLFQGKSIQIDNSSLVGRLLGFGENLGKRMTDSSLAGFGARGNIVGSAQYVGKALGNERLGQDVGYMARGALGLSPFQAVTPQQKQYELRSSPVNFRQKAFQDVGQGLYGSALTAPLAGGALGVVKNMAVGTGLGLGMGVGSDLLSKKPITKQGLAEHALSGFQNSWVLPLTNKATDMALSKIAPKLVSDVVANPFKVGEIKNGIANLFQRALAEVPAENTAFTFLNRLDEKTQASFVEEWLKNIPGNVITNVGFAGVSAAGNIVGNKASREAVNRALEKTVRHWNLPVKKMYTTDQYEPYWFYRMKQKMGLQAQDINELSVEDYAKLKGISVKEAQKISDTQPTKGGGIYDINQTFYRGEGGSNKFTGVSSFVDGQNFATDVNRAKRFGDVTEYKLNPKAKIVSIDVRGRELKDIAKELGVSESAMLSPTKLKQELADKGYDAIVYKSRIVDKMGKISDASQTVTDAVAITNKAFSPTQPTKGGGTTLYHATPNKFDEFDLDRMEGGVAWFTDNPKEITNNTVGAVQGAGQKLNVMTRVEAKQMKWATPELQDKYYTDQLIQMGYDGVKMESPNGKGNWYKVFDPNNTLTSPTQPKGGVPEGGVLAQKQTEFNNLVAKMEAEKARLNKIDPNRQVTTMGDNLLSANDYNRMQELASEISSLKDKARGINSTTDLKEIVQLKRNLRKNGIPFNENASKQELLSLSPQPEGGVGGVKTVDLPPPPSTSQGLEPVGNILSQREGLTNKGIKPQLPDIQKPQLGGAGQSNGASNINIDPVQKIINALKEAKPLNQEQRNIYSKIRSQQAGALGGIGEQMGGEAGYFKKLGQLKGELPKVQFESIRKSLSQEDINSVFNKIEQSNLGVFEKINAQTGLRKLLGEQGGAVPTKSELALLNEVFPPEFIQAVLDNRSTFQKLLSFGEGVLNLPRAVMATADFSAPLRQGVFLVGRPRQWLPAFKEQFRYFANPKAYEGLMDDIRSRPNYKLYREAGLSLTDTSPILGSREEVFMSNLVERIPGFGKLAAGSNRAYTGFLNKLRVDVFDDLVKSAKSQGTNLEGKALQDVAKFINSATGRGDLGALQRAAPILNATLFSPRLVASRVNLLNPAFYVKLDPFARKEALKSLLTFGGTALTVLGLTKLAGAEVGSDPRSANFGKIKTGNTRYDILGGFQQYIKLASQLISGQIVSSTTGKTITLGEGYKPLTRKDILVRFFESKESPVASLITGMLSGKTGTGENFNLTEELVNRFIPLVAQDMYTLTKEYGAGGMLRGIPGIFGVGSQTYGKQEVVTGKNALGKPDVQIKPTTGLAEDIVAKLGGQREIGSTPQYSADAYYKQLKQMPKEQAKEVMLQIAKINPDVAKKILTAAEDEKKGITIKDKEIKAMGVKNGERAVAIIKRLNKMKTKEQKKAYLLDLARKGVINEEVLQQVIEAQGAIQK